MAKGFVLARMRGARHGWISDLYVSPDFRRGGAAGRLVRDAATALRERGADTIELDVRPWNGEALAVYERWGFRQSKLTLATKAGDLEHASPRTRRRRPMGSCSRRRTTNRAWRKLSARTCPG